MRRIRRKLGVLFGFLLLFCLLAAGLIYIRCVPVLCRLAQEQAKTAAQNQIENAVLQQIQSGSIAYDRIILFEKDVNGRITALMTNIREVNHLKAMILRTIGRRILALDEKQIGIPLGNFLLPELFAGIGPLLPVHILEVKHSSAAFLSQFSQAGINQTLHQLRMNVQVDGTVLVLGQVRSFSASGNVLVAETVIVGEVPHTFS